MSCKDHEPGIRLVPEMTPWWSNVCQSRYYFVRSKRGMLYVFNVIRLQMKLHIIRTVEG